MDRLDALYLFVAVAEDGGFSAGARRRGVSPASATRAVNALEARLGLGLFVRTTRAVRLTEAGQDYLDRVRLVLDGLERADASALGASTRPTGRLRITGPVRFGVLHLMPTLAAFLDAYPQVTAEAVLLDRIVNLIDEGFDVALRIGSLPESGLVARRVGEVRQVVCAAPHYLDRHGVPRRPADLANHEVVSVDPVTPRSEWRFAGGVVARIAPKLTVNVNEAAIEAARRGQGLTRVLSYQVADAVAAGALRIVMADHEPAPIPVHLVHAEGRAASAKLRAFLDLAGPVLRSRLGSERIGR